MLEALAASAPLTHDTGGEWVDRNQRALVAELAGVRAALERHLAKDGSVAATVEAATGVVGPRPKPAPPAPTLFDPSPPAIDMATRLFGLSPFERTVLVLCAGIELDSSIPRLCAKANGDPAATYPTFSLALAALEGAHWSALAPGAPLRRWRLIEPVQQPPLPMTSWPLRIDERILHYLAGVGGLDERLAGYVQRAEIEPIIAEGHHVLAHELARTWNDVDELPVMFLVGATEAGRRSIAGRMASDLGLGVQELQVRALPGVAHELDGFVRLWDREAALSSLALYVDLDATESADDGQGKALRSVLERSRAPLIAGAREPLSPLRRRSRVVEVPRLTRTDQRRLWAEALGDLGLQSIDALVAQFDLDAAAIGAAAREALATGDGASEGTVWDASRKAARRGLDGLAQRLETIATWDDIVLPEGQQRQLREIVGQVANQSTVYDDWGFRARGSRGLGISALFVGASGTGKTLAAEVLASTLRLDLYRIDLSSVVSKYIGETEKNLRRLFDAAEEGGAILFFDEADALFGKRTEVRDSHDRYANIEVNYLLQRMESYRGVAILATNLKGALDAAFLRRIRFVVNFPMPDPAQRAEIWRRSFPTQTPTRDLDLSLLARLDIAGGNIRNIAMNAAFLAAAAGEQVRMTHIATATRAEYGKLDRPLPDKAVEAWR